MKNPNTIHQFTTKQLSPLQISHLSNLVQICNSRDNSNFSYPVEESCVHFLSYHQDTLTSALCIYFPTDEICECVAFTHPDFRHQGQFSSLLSETFHYLDQLERHIRQDTELCFVTCGYTQKPCDDTCKTLQALDTEYLYSEYMMNCSLKPYTSSSYDFPSLNIIMENQDTKEVSCRFEENHQVIGCCEYLKHGSVAYIHHMEISPDLRNKGYGTKFLLLLLQKLSCDNFQIACLEVSSENLAAMALYKKTGFQIYEILSYWWL